MSLSNYDELQEAIKDWLIRPDLTNQAKTFISLAEATFSRHLRVRQMVNRSRLVIDDRYVPLPMDWDKAWNVQRVEDNTPLQYLSPGEMDKKRTQERPSSSCPTHYSLFGDSLELNPSPTVEDPVEIEMIYYAKVPPLTDSRPVNWLLTTHPDIYLYGALVHSAPFLMDDPRLQVWQTLYEKAVASANESDTDARRSGSPMIQPVRTF